jgi:integrase
LLDTGCRASELCGLKMQDVTFAPDTAWILVHGKGRKEREIKLGRKARLALSRYVHRERKSDSERVFIGRKGPLTAEGLDRMLYRLRDAAGRQHFTGVTVGAHRWRHTYAVMALMAGMDSVAVSRNMGHADIGVTMNYLKSLTSQQVMRMAISPLDVMGQVARG